MGICVLDIMSTSSSFLFGGISIICLVQIIFTFGSECKKENQLLIEEPSNTGDWSKNPGSPLPRRHADWTTYVLIMFGLVFPRQCWQILGELLRKRPLATGMLIQSLFSRGSLYCCPATW